MGSVSRLDLPRRQMTPVARQGALIERFANRRRSRWDVFWLKENAELLNVLHGLGAVQSPEALAPFAQVYAQLPEKLGFFPQYYRFLLSICLDLEDLGLPGDAGARAVRWVDRQGLVLGELSDLQRAEARRLCLRRGVDPLHDPGLEDRLRRFAARCATFALPNRKAAYELTHVVFYLSDYGRRDPGLDDDGRRSLYYAGTLAFLERNVDLLAEICIALRFARGVVPPLWQAWLHGQVRRFDLSGAVPGRGGAGQGGDDYHPYLMLNWSLGLSGQGGFGAQIPEGALWVTLARPDCNPLREMSEALYALGARRCDDWGAMGPLLNAALSPPARHVLQEAETGPEFPSFFALFARAGGPGGG